jgi:hypothetical protein
MNKWIYTGTLIGLGIVVVVFALFSGFFVPGATLEIGQGQFILLMLGFIMILVGMDVNGQTSSRKNLKDNVLRILPRYRTWFVGLLLYSASFFYTVVKPTKFEIITLAHWLGIIFIATGIFWVFYTRTQQKLTCADDNILSTLKVSQSTERFYLMVVNMVERQAPVVPKMFYLVLVGLGLIWFMLGNTWYANILPFYDSLSYQTRVEGILRAYQTHGWGIIPSGLDGPNAFLYIPFFAFLAPILPVSRTVLYLYFIPIHLIAMAALFNFLRRKTGSLSLAILGPALYISTTPFVTLYAGILDQRMDLATTSFSLLLWVTALDWAEDTVSRKKTIVLGIMTALVFLHRPVISIQASLVVMMFVLYAYWTARQSNQLKNYWQHLGLAALIAGCLSIPWFLTNTYAFYRYYVLNTTFIGASPFSETIPGYWEILMDLIGGNVIILAVFLILSALALGKLPWRYFFLVLGVIILPLVTLILSGSYSSVVAEISLAGIGLLPLTFENKGRSDQGIRIVITLAALGLASWNLISLAHMVNQVDRKERTIAETAILNIAKINPTNKPLYLSGFISAMEGPDTIVSVARLELGLRFELGALRFHPFQFGLPAETADYSERELDLAAACGLQRAFDQGGILMLVEPSRVEEKEIQSWLSEHAFANRLAARMDRMALASGRLEDIGVTAVSYGIPVHFYNILPGKDLPIDEDCP